MKLFRKPNSKFYWYDVTVRSRRYRGSTQEINAARASTVAGLKLAQIVEGTDPLPKRATSLDEFAKRFLVWLDASRLEHKTKKYYRNGWRLWKATATANMRLDEIRSDWVDQFKFAGSSANANCALRTLRRMLHKAEEWKLISRVPTIKLMKEHGRSLTLDDATERKLLEAAAVCKWRKRTNDLFRDIVILMRDTGMRNQRELYRMRLENLEWEKRLIFVPDSKTSRRQEACSDESASLRNSARTLRHKAGRLGISIGALGEWPRELDRSIVSPSTHESRPFQRPRLVLRTA